MNLERNLLEYQARKKELANHMASPKRLQEHIILIKGAGEKASAVAHLLHQRGLRRIVMTDLALPLTERRGVSFCEAILDGQKEVGGVISQRVVPHLSKIIEGWEKRQIPILADSETKILESLNPDVLIDAIMAKRNTGTAIGMAPLVIALGPGFTAGTDVHLIVETNPASPHLGRLISNGPAEEESGIPTEISGFSRRRLIVSPGSGVLRALKKIGDPVIKNEVIATVDGRPISANIPGIIWGLIRDGGPVKAGQKIGDIDPRGDPKSCFEITPQARMIADDVLKGILSRFPNSSSSG
jgi:xanthine dehydrogenase accessory factor